MSNNDLLEFIKQVEVADFRSENDTGTSDNSLYIWNKVRAFALLAPLKREDLPAYCAFHMKYHIIREDYECKRVM